MDADVRLLPPVQQGDLLRLRGSLPDVLGIVDGFFFQVPSILHKEILWAMEQGVRVLGAASLGALRAAELDVFGMEGVGAIYRMYKQGLIEADDEVAVLHADGLDGYRPLSDALVNIRHNLRLAVARRIVSARTARTVLDNARRLHFTQRTYQAALALTDTARGGRDEVDALREFLRTEAIDLKRDDALSLVQTVGERLQGHGTWPPPHVERINHTIYLHLFQRQYVGQQADGEYVPDAIVLGLQKLLTPSFARLFRRIALRCVVLDEARERGLAADPDEALVSCFRARADLRQDGTFQAWLRERSLMTDELTTCLRERDIEQRVLAQYDRLAPGSRGKTELLHRVVADVAARTGLDDSALTRPPRMRPGIPWEAPLVRELKLRGRYAAAVELASQIVRVNAELADRLPGLSQALSRERLEHYVAALWNVEVSVVPAAMLERGFSHYGELLAIARLAFAAERVGAMDIVPHARWRSALTSRGVTGRSAPQSQLEARMASSAVHGFTAEV